MCPAVSLRSLATQFVAHPPPRGDDVIDDVFGVPSHTAQECRAERVEEEEPNEVQTGTGLDDSPIVNREAVVSRYRRGRSSRDSV